MVKSVRYFTFDGDSVVVLRALISEVRLKVHSVITWAGSCIILHPVHIICIVFVQGCGHGVVYFEIS